MNYAIFLKLRDQMQFEVNYVKSHIHVISDGLNGHLSRTDIFLGGQPIHSLLFLPLYNATSLKCPLSSVPKVAVVDRFNSI